MLIDPVKIKPAIKGESDFFSWQLYRWVKQNPGATRIFIGPSLMDGIVGDSYPSPWLHIGQRIDGWVSGARLRTICCRRAKLQSWAYLNSNKWPDVTEQFWAEYLRIGVCAIWGSGAHKWELSGTDKRKCLYCDRREIMQIEMTPTERWKEAQ